MRKILLITIGLSVGLMADFSRDNTTEVVTDNVTHLQWQDNNDAKTITKTWTEAIAYCESLMLGGHNDWRLPNFNELYFIADRTKSNPATDSIFQNVVSGNYWSSTTVVSYEYIAWGVYFNLGDGYWFNKSFSNYVRCVRAGQ